MPRPFAAHTPLGQALIARAMTATELSAKTGIHPRTLTEILAGRKRIAPLHLTRLCEALDCNPEDIQYIPSVHDQKEVSA